MITRNTILNRTHHGTGIYSHYMRQNYPDRIVMHIKGRDCGNCPNPFDEGKECLHVWFEKIYPEKKLVLTTVLIFFLRGHYPRFFIS